MTLPIERDGKPRRRKAEESRLPIFEYREMSSSSGEYPGGEKLVCLNRLSNHATETNSPRAEGITNA